MNILFPSLFSLVFVGIGAGIISFGRNTAAKAKQSSSWPTTEGEIAHSAVLFQTDTSNTGSASTYKADIVYRYKVHGRSYSSSKIAFLDLATSSTNRAQNLVDRYPDNSTVQVYYNPANPAESVLEPGDASGITFLYLVGSLFAAGGLFFLIMSLTGHVHVR